MERLVCISANGRWLSSADRVGAAGSITQDMPTVRCTGVPLCTAQRRTAGTAPQAPHRMHRERLVCISANGRWLSSAGRVGAARSLTQDMPTVRCTGVSLGTAPRRTAPHRKHRTVGTASHHLAVFP